MPLTPFQREVARLLATNRNPNSMVAGGTVINRGEDGLRYSEDLDIFNDPAVSAEKSADLDVATLTSNGYLVDWVFRHGERHRANVSKESERLRLDWVTDTAFRFFPAQEDEEFGYCLHMADLATNKILALAGRSEARDLLDVLELDRDYLSLGATIWAACGKDQGFTPDSMLNWANQNARHREADFQGERLSRPIDLRALKDQWLEAMSAARQLFDSLPPDELGFLYLNAAGDPVTPDPADAAFAALTRRSGSVGGAWPTISDADAAGSQGRG